MKAGYLVLRGDVTRYVRKRNLAILRKYVGKTNRIMNKKRLPIVTIAIAGLPQNTYRIKKITICFIYMI